MLGNIHNCFSTLTCKDSFNRLHPLCNGTLCLSCTMVHTSASFAPSPRRYPVDYTYNREPGMSMLQLLLVLAAKNIPLIELLNKGQASRQDSTDGIFVSRRSRVRI